MDTVSRRRALAVFGAGLSGVAGCNAVGLGTQTGAIEVRNIERVPPMGAVSVDVAGFPMDVSVSFENPGDQTATEGLDVSVDGDVVQTWTIELAGGERDERTFTHTFKEPGEHEVAAGGTTERFRFSEAVDIETNYTAAGQYAVRPDRHRGVASVRISVRHEHDEPVPFAPNIRIGGEHVEELRVITANGPGERMNEPIPPGRWQGLTASRVVDTGEEYEVAVDGETVGSVSLDHPDTQYRYGNPDRTGPSVPHRGVGTDLELVERFPVEVEAEPADVMGLEPLAVAADRLYLRAWWEAEGDDGFLYEEFSLLCYDRWTGEKYWEEGVDRPAEIAVVDGTEYVLDGGTLRSRPIDGAEDWTTELAEDAFGDVAYTTITDTAMVPTTDAIYVGTPDGTRVVDPDSGDVRHTLAGRYPAVSDAGVFTWDETTVRQFAPGKSEPAWTTDLDTEETGRTIAISRDEGIHRFTEYGLVADDLVVVLSYVPDGADTRYLVHGFDVESGEEQLRTTVVESRPAYLETANTNRAVAVTDFGGETKMITLPEVVQPVVKNGLLYVGTTFGLDTMLIDSGEAAGLDEEVEFDDFGDYGTYPTVANRGQIYQGFDDHIQQWHYISTTWISEQPPLLETPSNSLYEGTPSRLLFGRDSLYYVEDGYVNVVGGTLPGTAGSASGDGA